MKVKSTIGTAMLAVMLGTFNPAAFNPAFADEGDINLVGPKGWAQFFTIKGYDLNENTRLMELVVVPHKTCKKMYVSFKAENDGIIESQGGFFVLYDTEPGQQHRTSMMTGVKYGGLLRLESAHCLTRDGFEKLDEEEGYTSFPGYGSRYQTQRPNPTTNPSLIDIFRKIR